MLIENKDTGNKESVWMIDYIFFVFSNFLVLPISFLSDEFDGMLLNTV